METGGIDRTHHQTTTVRHGQGKKATTEQLVTEVVGLEGLTSYAEYGTCEHAKHKNRKHFVANPINAVVVRKWDNRNFGTGGKIVYLTNERVTVPLTVFHEYDDRSLIENCCMKEGKQAWSFQHPPQKTDQAVKIHVLFTLIIFALATAYRLVSERQDTNPDDDHLGWQRWRRKVHQENKDKIIVFCGGYYGILHVAEFSMLAGFKVKTPPPEIGSPHDVFARYGLAEMN